MQLRIDMIETDRESEANLFQVINTSNKEYEPKSELIFHCYNLILNPETGKVLQASQTHAHNNNLICFGCCEADRSLENSVQ